MANSIDRSADLCATSRPHDLRAAAGARELEMIVNQAAAAIGTPMALISLLDEGRQWFRARIGIDLTDTPLASSFCAHAIRGAGIFCVGDAARDSRFAANPLVTGRPHIRFYAGATLRLDGVGVGALCVLDDQPRVSFSKLEEGYLTYLADRAVAALTTYGWG